MCGIVGYCGYQNAKNIVTDGLKTLEYRGYDSAGIALCSKNGIELFKTVGRVKDLINILPDISSRCGIGHTRWATHGVPSACNSHPHLSFDGKIAIAHNGVIENCDELKAELTSKGITFKSQTDSEIIAHLLALAYDGDMMRAIEQVAKRLRGATTFLAIRQGEDAIYLHRCGASLAVGLGIGENFVASDTLAISAHTRKIVSLADGENAKITSNQAIFFKDGKRIFKQPEIIRRAQPKECSCHMRAEIDEIPTALTKTHESITRDFDLYSQNAIHNAKKIYFIGCGTAYHAGLYGKEMFEKHLHIPCECVVASEATSLRFIDSACLAIAITQSGETADTLLAVDYFKSKGAKTIALTNVEGSSITYSTNKTLLLDAGAEIAVAATKSYNCQLFALYLMATLASNKRFEKHALDNLLSATKKVMEQSLYEDKVKSANLFFVGKGLDNATAKEGALKFKEITYKMTDAYSAGELKHGAIALIDEKSIAIVIATNAENKAKLQATVNEIRSRGAVVYALSAVGDIGADKTFAIPFVDDDLYSLIAIIPLQNLALTASLCLGLNPDKPRNLAKSVTVI